MVAVKSTFFALSLASISLVDAAAVNTPPSSPMKRMIRERADSTAKKTAPLGEAFSKRQKEQARFEVRHVEERRDAFNASNPGRVDITSPTTNGSTTLGSLLYNNATGEMDASPDQHSTIYMAPLNTQSSEVALEMPINGSSYCITYDPNPPAPAPLYAERCFNESTAATSNSSQKFQYDSDNGIVTPMWSANNSTGVAQRAASPQDRLTFVRDDAAAREAVESASASSASTSVSTSASQPSQSTSSAAVSPPKPAVPVGTPALPVAPPARQAESASASSTSRSTSTPSASPPVAPPKAPVPVGTPALPVAPARQAESASASSTSQSASTPSASSTLPVAAPKPPVGVPTPPVTAPVPARQAASASQSQSDSLSPSQSASIVAQEPDAASSTTASSSATPTAGAFEVELASSSASSAASTSSLDASAVADDIVTSAASDSNTSSSAPTSTPSVSPPTGQEQQAVYVGRAAREEMVPVPTEPYQWKFSPESREW
ncbi:hypothetical protein C8R46DRAFT_119459 [Mycena filopes]|nr:hypothetical protein C8R46DRAFT_119459 [Mycena filopes]